MPGAVIQPPCHLEGQLFTKHKIMCMYIFIHFLCGRATNVVSSDRSRSLEGWLFVISAFITHGSGVVVDR